MVRACIPGAGVETAIPLAVACGKPDASKAEMARPTGQGRSPEGLRPCHLGCLRHARGWIGGRGKYPAAETCAAISRGDRTGHNQSGWV